MTPIRNIVLHFAARWDTPLPPLTLRSYGWLPPASGGDGAADDSAVKKSWMLLDATRCDHAELTY